MAPSPQMDSSAMASRSAVLTPGATAARTRSSARLTTSPAARMSSICASVLIWMCCVRNTRSAPEWLECVGGPLGDILDRTGRIDAHQLALAGIEAHEGRGLGGVHPQPLGNGLRLVVVALEEL